MSVRHTITTTKDLRGIETSAREASFCQTYFTLLVSSDQSTVKFIRGATGVENEEKNNLNFANKVFNRQDVLILFGLNSGISLYMIHPCVFHIVFEGSSYQRYLVCFPIDRTLSEKGLVLKETTQSRAYRWLWYRNPETHFTKDLLDFWGKHYTVFAFNQAQ